jgi:hypothetical protein
MDRRQSALSAHILEAPRLTISNRPCWVAKGATQGAQLALQQPDSEGHLFPSASRALNSPSTNRVSETGGVGSPLCAIAGPDWIIQTSMQTISGARYLSIPLTHSRSACPSKYEPRRRSEALTLHASNGN